MGFTAGAAIDHTAFVIVLFIGVSAGWLASQAAGHAGFNRVADMAAGITGALAAGLLVPREGFMGGGFSAAIVAAVLGAIAVLLLVRLLRRA